MTRNSVQNASRECASPSWSPDGNYVFVSKAASHHTLRFGCTTCRVALACRSPRPSRHPRRRARDGTRHVAVASADGNIFSTRCRHGGFAYTQASAVADSLARTAHWGQASAATMEISFPGRSVSRWNANFVFNAVRDRSGCGFVTCRLATIAWSISMTRDDRVPFHSWDLSQYMRSCPMARNRFQP